MKLNKLFLFIIILSLVSISTTALKLSSNNIRVELDFQPGLERTYGYAIENEEGYPSSYNIIVVPLQGANLTPYLTITPDHFENVRHGEVREFHVTLSLPEEMPVPGESVAWAKIELDKSSISGGISAIPSVAATFRVFALYPYKYLEWNLNAPNMNINETEEIKIGLNNLGEPILNTIYADIEIYDLSNNQRVRTLRTSQSNNLEPKKTSSISATLDTQGLKAGNYRAKAILYWDNNVSRKEADFKIGRKEVKILDFTREFSRDKINRFNIKIQSGWSDDIEGLYAQVRILDGSKEVSTFTSPSYELKAWKEKEIEAFFDTEGLEKDNYVAQVILHFEGTTSIKEGEITLSDYVEPEVDNEKDNRKSGFSGLSGINIGFNAVTFLIFLLIIFIIIMVAFIIYYISTQRKNEEVEEKPKDTDKELIDKIKALQRKYNNAYIIKMMVEKGWDKEKIDRLIKKAEDE